MNRVDEKGLADKVAALAAPSRDTDWDIHEALFGIDATGFHETPHYTASIDAAVALVEKVLPGWEWDVGSIHQDFRSDGEPRFIASVASPIKWVPPLPEEGGMDEPRSDAYEGRSEFPAIALILAALQSMGDRHG